MGERGRVIESRTKIYPRKCRCEKEREWAEVSDDGERSLITERGVSAIEISGVKVEEGVRKETGRVKSEVGKRIESERRVNKTRG